MGRWALGAPSMSMKCWLGLELPYDKNVFVYAINEWALNENYYKFN